MLAAGAQVLLTSERDSGDCPEVLAILAKYPGAARYLRRDILTEATAETLLDHCWGEFGGCDVLVNNVGTFCEPSFLDVRREQFEWLFRLNVWSALACSREFAQRCIAADRPGRIIFTTSLNATRSEPAHTLYDASKGAINALIRQLAVELAPHNITTVGIAPGLIETPLTDYGLASTPIQRRQIADQIPLRRIGTVADVAAWYAFLASPSSGYCTGQIITVDGGLDAQQMPARPIGAAERIGPEFQPHTRIE